MFQPPPSSSNDSELIGKNLNSETNATELHELTDESTSPSQFDSGTTDIDLEMSTESFTMNSPGNMTTETFGVTTESTNNTNLSKCCPFLPYCIAELLWHST